VLAAIIVGIVLSLGTDLGLHATGLFPALGEPMSDPLLGLATLYRTVYGVGCAYLAARLAPNRPMGHVMVLGVLGFVVNLAGAVATWNRVPPLGPHWYPVALTALAIPTAWAGGKLYGEGRK